MRLAHKALGLMLTVKFGSIKAIFGVIWGGFEELGPCLRISHPTHPHLGKLSQIKPFFYSSPNGYWTLSFAIKTIILTNLLDWSCPDDPSLVNWNEKTKNCGCVSSTAVWQPNDSLLLRPRPARLFTILTLLFLKEKKDVFALYWYSSYCGNCRALFISFFAVNVF